MSWSVCPSCGETIKLAGQPRISQKVTCRYCDESLEIIDVNPIELDWAYYDDDDDEWSIDEDYEDYDDEEWDA